MYHTIHRGLNSIYQKRYAGIYRHAKKLFVFDIILLVSALAILVTGILLLFWHPSLANQIDLTATFNNNFKSGEYGALAITYSNRSKYDLNNAVLSVHLPPGFVVDRLKTPTSTLDERSQIHLDKILTGETNRREVWGYFWADVTTDNRLLLLLSYEPSELNRREQKIAPLFFHPTQSLLNFTWPNQLIGTAQSPLKVETAVNNASADQPLVSINYVINNIPAGKKPPAKLASGNAAANLLPNSSSTVTWNSVYPTVADAQLNISLTVVANGTELTQSVAQTTLAVYESGLHCVINLATTTLAVPNGEATLNTVCANQGNHVIKNLTLGWNFSAPIVDLVASAKLNNFSTDDQKLLATPTLYPALAELLPGAQISLSTKLKFKPTFNLAGQTNVLLNITTAQTGLLRDGAGNLLTNFEDHGDGAPIKIATDISARAVARFYTDEGDQLGRGALPPSVGETTKYWVLIKITNTTNDARDVKFDAQLPPGVAFTGKQSVTMGQPIQVSADGRQISWRQTYLPANSTANLNFEVAVTPTASQVGTNLVLLKNTILTAADDWTNNNYQIKLPNTTNVLPASDMGHQLGSQVVGP
jgi:hypothetical protein